MAKVTKHPSLGEPVSSGIKGTPTAKPMDTVHVKTDAGYKIVVGRGSNYAKQATSLGAVPGNLRPGGPYNEGTDPFSVKNYSKKK
jgi:hypothetical protein